MALGAVLLPFPPAAPNGNRRATKDQRAASQRSPCMCDARPKASSVSSRRAISSSRFWVALPAKCVAISATVAGLYVSLLVGVVAMFALASIWAKADTFYTPPPNDEAPSFRWRPCSSWEPPAGFEPATCSLRMSCSTAELGRLVAAWFSTRAANVLILPLHGNRGSRVSLVVRCAGVSGVGRGSPCHTDPKARCP